MNKKTEVLDNRCPHCGAKIDFNPKTNNFKCEYCGKEVTLEEMEKYNTSNTAAAKNKQVTEENVDNYDEYITYTCEDCGAEIIADAQTTATFCVYCGNNAILKNKLSGKFSPKEIIPFKKEKEDAVKAFISLSKGRPLVPKSFTNQKNIEKIRGIYIPFWFHNFHIEGQLQMKGTTYDHWSVGDTYYTRTKIYELIREGNTDFKSVPVDGSTRFNNALMNTIQPYDYNDLVPYNHAYLAGFLAERYDVESNETRKEVEPSILNDVKNMFKNDASMYGVSKIKSNTLATTNYSVEYVLLPVYMVNVKYMGKMYTFAMNGQTGEFIGNIPVDKIKFILITLSLLTSLLLFLWALSFILYKVGV